MNRIDVDRTWAQIDLSTIRSNVDQVFSLLRPSVRLMGVVKADAYGHGAVEIAHTLVDAGVQYLAVSLLDEGIQLRKHGIKVPILILSYTASNRAAEIVEYKLTQAIYSWEILEALDAAAKQVNQVAHVHIKVDTGMRRIGFASGFDSVQEIQKMMELSNIRIEGIFTHFATADMDSDKKVKEQFNQFLGVCKELERQGSYIPIKHCCNGAATLKYPEYHMDMVRVGGLLYGMGPDCEESKNLHTAMTLKSTVIHAKEIKPGESVGYGTGFIAQHQMKIATVPVGFADGYSRSLYEKAFALLRGRRMHLVGRPCMDGSMFDISEVEEAIQMGEEVVLFGKQGDENLTIVEFANWLNTIPYEVTCLIGRRVPRVYIEDGEVKMVQRYLN